MAIMIGVSVDQIINARRVYADLELAAATASKQQKIAWGCSAPCIGCCSRPIPIAAVGVSLIGIGLRALAKTEIEKIVDRGATTAAKLHEDPNAVEVCPLFQIETGTCAVREYRPIPCRSRYAYDAELGQGYPCRPGQKHAFLDARKAEAHAIIMTEPRTISISALAGGDKGNDLYDLRTMVGQIAYKIIEDGSGVH